MCKTELHTTYIKVKFCEKAAKIWRNHFLLTLLSNVKKEGDFVKLCVIPRISIYTLQKPRQSVEEGARFYEMWYKPGLAAQN